MAVDVQPVKVFEYDPVPVTEPDAELPPDIVRVCVSIPERGWIKVLLLVGVKRDSEVTGVPRKVGETMEDIVVIGPDDETDEPPLLFVGDEGREL